MPLSVCLSPTTDSSSLTASQSTPQFWHMIEYTATSQAPVAQIAHFIKERQWEQERRGEESNLGGRWCGRWSEIDATAGQPWPTYRQTLTQGDEDLGGLGIQA